MSVCCECCVLSGRGLWDGLITRPEESYGCLSVMSVVSCQVEIRATGWSLVQRSHTDCGASLCLIKKPQKWGGHDPRWAAAPQKTNKLLTAQKAIVCPYDLYYSYSLRINWLQRHNLYGFEYRRRDTSDWGTKYSAAACVMGPSHICTVTISLVCSSSNTLLVLP